MTLIPDISVITPCYNSERFIERTIESVKAQTYAGWEHVVVDDGSYDQSAELVRAKLDAEPRLRLVRQPNLGVGSARNSGLRASSPNSRYVLFLDADDCLESTALEELGGYLARHPEAGMVYCAWSNIDAHDKLLAAGVEAEEQMPRYAPSQLGFHVIPDHDSNTPFTSLMASFGALPSGSLMRRSAFLQAGGWDEEMTAMPICVHDDQDLVLRMALITEVHFLSRRLVRYRRHDSNMTSQAFYSSFAAFHRRWWRGENLSPQSKRLARHAILFDLKLNAYLELRAGWGLLRSGNVMQSMGSVRRGGKKAAAYAFGHSSWTLEECGSIVGRYRSRQHETSVKSLRRRS